MKHSKFTLWIMFILAATCALNKAACLIKVPDASNADVVVVLAMAFCAGWWLNEITNYKDDE